MAKKYFQRALSVGLSLALCASMVAPGFAASFTELQGAIDSGNSVYKDGYSDSNKAEKDEDTYKIKVEAGKDDEGNDTRVVTLYEDVEFDKSKDYLKSTGEEGPGYGYSDGKAGIVIGENSEAPINNVTLDLNGHDIDLNPGWEVVLDKEGEEPWNTEPVKYEWTDPTRTPPTQETGAPTETPTGAPTETPTHTVWATDAALNQGDVIYVAEGSKLTVKDSEARWTGSLDTSSDTSATDNSSLASSVPEYVGGKITGSAMNSAINNQGTLIMDSGEISGNASNFTAGIRNNGTFEMNGGVIRNNKTAVRNTGDFTMNGGQISENFGSRGAVELEAGGSFTMNGGLIAGNGTSVSTLDSVNEYDDLDSTVKIHGGTIIGNVVRWLHSSSRYSKLYALSNLGTVTLPEDSDVVSVNKDGSIDFPAGTRIEKGNAEYIGVGAIHVDGYGSMTGQLVAKIENSDKSVTITGINGTQNKITDANGGEVILDENGTTTVPAGSKITNGNSETTCVGETTIDKDGSVIGEGVTKTDNGDGTVTITDTKGEEHEITDTNNGKVTVDNEGNTNVPAGGKITDKDGSETTYPDGATIDKGGNITGEGGSVTRTDNGDGTTTIKTDNGKDGEENKTTETKVDVPDGKDVTVDGKGTTTIPEGSKITDENGNETTYPDGTTIDKDGNVNGEKDDNTTDPSVTKDKETGDVTIDDGKGNQTTITVPTDKKDDVTVNPDGSVTVPEGGKVTDKDGNETELPNGGTVNPDGTVTGDPAISKTDKEDGTTDVTVTDKDGNETTITVPTDKKDDVTVNPDGSVTVPEGGKLTDKDGNETELPNGGTVNPDGTVKPNPNTGSQGGSTGANGGAGEADVVVIDGVEVPLSGLVSVEDVLSVLYRLAESAEGGVERDDVIAWAIENGIIDDETDVEEIVTVAALRAILANYARAFGLDVDVSTLASLAGEDDDVVMNCDEVIDEFFAKAKEDEAA